MANEKKTAPLLQKLIQFDTTNPPGNEYLVIEWIQQILDQAGIEYSIYAKNPSRPNLIARIKGEGSAPPLLLQGHVDVVTTKGQEWEHPPFSGEVIDGYIWGRGALDMKGGVAMMLSAFLSAHENITSLPGDVILCLLADEEAGGDFGAKFLVEEHPEIFQGVRYALGEGGGFSLNISGKPFYPIMVAEKRICWIRILIHGSAGHGSMIHRGGTMAKLGHILQTLDKKRLPVHITPPVRMMFEEISCELPFPINLAIKQLLNPLLTDFILGALGTKGKLFEPLFHNTLNATIVRASDKINVIPSTINLELDGRILPGQQPADLIREVREALGKEYKIEIVRHDAGPAEPDLGWFPTLKKILKELDPSGHPVPFVMMGVTDARHFSKLGIQTYGFTPMKFPSNFKFDTLAHAANERIPVNALEFGKSAMLQAMMLNQK